MEGDELLFSTMSYNFKAQRTSLPPAQNGAKTFRQNRNKRLIEESLSTLVLLSITKKRINIQSNGRMEE